MDDRESLDYQQVRDEFQQMMAQAAFEPQGEVLSAEMLWDILGLAAVTGGTIHSSTRSMEAGPSSATVLNHLRTGWLEQVSVAELEAQVNELLSAQLPRGIRGNRHEVAIDIVAIPYHGQAQEAADEIRRSQAKAGTSHFHMYATVYLIRRQTRLTLALAYWRAAESLVSLVERLLARLRALQVRPRRLLVDRQFATVSVLRYLDAQPFQTILPVPARSQRLKQLKQARRSQRTRYTMRSPEHGTLTFDLHVVGTYRKGRRGQHGRECLLFAVLGTPWRGSFYRLRHKYRTRFGIEASYRQLNRVRARTTSRDPKLRLLLVALGFTLLNLWRALCWVVLAVPRRGGRYLDQSLFCLYTFTAFLYDAIRDVRPPLRRVARPSAVP